MPKSSIKESEVGYISIVIRNEKTKDYHRIEEVAREAFWNLYPPDVAEHYVVHQMHSHIDFIPGLVFVAEMDGIVGGATFYAHSKIVTGQGESPTISFGPVFISLGYHRQGLGRSLITHSVRRAKEMGHSAILMPGYPYHYEPYGSCDEKKFDIVMVGEHFYKGLLVLPLKENALHGRSGYVVFSDALEAEGEDILDFDATFPQREEKVLSCQQKHETACTILGE